MNFNLYKIGVEKYVRNFIRLQEELTDIQIKNIILKYVVKDLMTILDILIIALEMNP